MVAAALGAAVRLARQPDLRGRLRDLLHLDRDLQQRQGELCGRADHDPGRRGGAGPPPAAGPSRGSGVTAAAPPAAPRLAGMPSLALLGFAVAMTMALLGPLATSDLVYNRTRFSIWATNRAGHSGGGPVHPGHRPCAAQRDLAGLVDGRARRLSRPSVVRLRRDVRPRLRGDLRRPGHAR